MKVRVRRRDYSVLVLIDPFGEDGMFRDLITVARRKSLRDGKWKPAEINWHCIGSVNQKRALLFANALSRATGYAERLDLDCGANIREQD